MGNLKGEGWRGNVGVRWVQTEQTSDANNPSPAGSIENVFGNYDPISVDHDYDDILPSVNLAFDLTDDVVLRFAAARVMARPDYTDVTSRGKPQHRSPERLDGQPADRSVSCEPVRPVARVVSRQGCRGRGGAVLQGREVVHHRPRRDAQLQRADGHIPEPRVHAGGRRPVQLPVHAQRAHQRRRRRDPGRRVLGYAADLGRLRRPGELHLHRREGRQRRPDPGQLEGRVQRDRATSRISA